MRRICCFCESWASGGIESFLSNSLMQMDLSDLEVDIVACRIEESVFRRKLETRGVRFVELSGKLRSPENSGAFRRLIRQRGYDVIHFNLFQGLAFHFVDIAKREGVHVRIIHGHVAGLRKSAARSLKLLLHRMGQRLWLSSATELWACSGQAARFLFGRRARSARIVPNGIDTAAFAFSEEKREAVRAALGLKGRTVIGTVGRMSPEKNQTFLLDVFASFFKDCPDSCLLLIGTGSEEPALRRKAEELGVADYVIFYGVTQNVAELLSAMDVFVFPSLMEGFGIAGVEAQASGLPVLCSEQIPSETLLTPWVRRAALDRGPQFWAEELAACLQEQRDRTDGVCLVREAGYDISNTVQQMTDGFLR